MVINYENNKHGYQIVINYIGKTEEDEICMTDVYIRYLFLCSRLTQNLVS